MIRDQELNRLISYAKALNVNIVKKPSTRNTPEAEWTIDGTQITIYMKKRSKTEEILLIIHELAHHKSWINRGRKEYMKTHQAYDAQMKADNKILAKRHRKVIYETEKNDTDYWDEIIRDVDIKINPKRIKLEKEMDIWIYKQYYLTGEFPSGQEIKDKRKQLRAL